MLIQANQREFAKVPVDSELTVVVINVSVTKGKKSLARQLIAERCRKKIHGMESVLEMESEKSLSLSSTILLIWVSSTRFTRMRFVFMIIHQLR